MPHAIPYNTLLKTAIAKLNALGHGATARKISYATDRGELASCLREYILENDAKTNAFLREAEQAAYQEMLGSKLDRNQIATAISADFKTRLLAILPADTLLGNAAQIRLQQILFTNHNDQPNANASLGWKQLLDDLQAKPTTTLTTE